MHEGVRSMRKETKTKVFRVRMSDRERELLEKNVKKHNKKNASDYIRMLIENDGKENEQVTTYE